MIRSEAEIIPRRRVSDEHKNGKSGKTERLAIAFLGAYSVLSLGAVAYLSGLETANIPGELWVLSATALGALATMLARMTGAGGQADVQDAQQDALLRILGELRQVTLREREK